MKHEVKIPQSLKFGGFDYSIDMSEETARQLQGRANIANGLHQVLEQLEVRFVK